MSDKPRSKLKGLESIEYGFWFTKRMLQITIKDKDVLWYKLQCIESNRKIMLSTIGGRQFKHGGISLAEAHQGEVVLNKREL